MRESRLALEAGFQQHLVKLVDSLDLAWAVAELAASIALLPALTWPGAAWPT
jgi:hypothetical protein